MEEPGKGGGLKEPGEVVRGAESGEMGERGEVGASGDLRSGNMEGEGEVKAVKADEKSKNERRATIVIVMRANEERIAQNWCQRRDGDKIGTKRVRCQWGTPKGRGEGGRGRRVGELNFADFDQTDNTS